MEQTKKFEVNAGILENFDKIMAVKLDQIKELKISGLDKTSKLCSIISLCSNLKTLIIEGDSRINCDKILSYVLKKERLEKLILNGVKLPKAETLEKYTNLKMISLNEIRNCAVTSFLKGIVYPEKIESLNLSNTDLANRSLAVLERFCDIKYLNLEKLKNAKLGNLDFLKENENLLKVSMIDCEIPIHQVNHLLEIQCAKEIFVDLLEEKEKVLKGCKLQLQEDKKTIFILPAKQVKNVYPKVDLNKIDKINLVLDVPIKDKEWISILSNLKTKIGIFCKDFSCIPLSQALELKQTLKIRKIVVNAKKYWADDLIESLQKMDLFLTQIPQNWTKTEKFLQLYKILGEEFDELNEPNLEISEFLQNCLQCLKIQNNQIKGKILENGKKHFWNQVKLGGKWYHVDLALDLENIKHKKVKYCLLSDDNFFKTHKPVAGKNHYCAEDFNTKLVYVFFKTGLFKEKLLVSYFHKILAKLKKIFYLHKTQKHLLLPRKRYKRIKKGRQIKKPSF